MNLGTILLTGLLVLSPIAITDDPVPGPASTTAVTRSASGPANDQSAPISSPQRPGASGSESRLTGMPFSSRGNTSSQDFDWPTSSITVLRKFDHLENNWDSGHRGVDLASRPDEQIRAAGPGRIVYAGRVVDNNVISIEHSDGFRTTYQPVKATVKEGDMVQLGDIIGTLDDGHCLVGACLHWGAKRGDIYYDPLSLLTPEEVRVRLYPVSDP